jgi:AmmeMemoRadiSam system protein B
LYPDNPDDIKAAFAAYGLERNSLVMNRAEKCPAPCRGTALAVIAPHGAWNLSGEAAAAAFLSCAGRRNVRRVVILGTVHEEIRRGIFLSGSHAFDTPLGKLPVDAAATETLASCSTLFEINDIPHLRECSIEALLPFVKYCFPHVSIVPVLTGRCSPPLIKALAAALSVTFGAERDETLFVISSCLSRNELSGAAFAQADLFTRLVMEGDGPALESRFLDGGVSGCGSPLAAAFLESGLARNSGNRLLPGARQIPGSQGFVCYGSLALE